MQVEEDQKKNFAKRKDFINFSWIMSKFDCARKRDKFFFVEILFSQLPMENDWKLNWLNIEDE